MTITYRDTKGSKLTIAELDENFRDLDSRSSGGGAVSSVAGKTGAVNLVKGDVGLSAVDNTADADKIVSTATALALSGKQATLVSGSNLRTINGQSLLGTSDIVIAGGGGAVSSVAGRTGVVVLAKADVGLANVDNTTDAGKPVSTAQATAIGLKQNTLVSGTSIKTVNGQSILGSGDLVIAGGGGAAAPVALTASTTLTEAAHANRDLNSTAAAAITFTLPATAATGAKFFGTNLGAGTLSVVLDGGGAVPSNALLPPTIDQFSAWEVRRHASGYVRVA